MANEGEDAGPPTGVAWRLCAVLFRRACVYVRVCDSERARVRRGLYARLNPIIAFPVVALL